MFLMSIAFAFVSCKPEETELGFKPSIGSKYRMTVNSSQKMDRESNGENVATTNIADYTLLYETTKSEGDFTAVKMIFERMKTVDKSMGSEAVMDSENKDTLDPISKIVASIKGAEFTMDINKQGEVKNMQGMDGLTKRMVDAAGKNLSPAQAAQMGESLKSVMSDDMLRSMTEQSFKIFPYKKVRVGDSWVASTKTKSIVDMIVTTTYTLQKIENGTATLGVSSVITPDGGEKVMDGQRVQQTLSGSQTGTMEVELASGMTMHASINQKSTGQLRTDSLQMNIVIDGTTSIGTVKL